MKKTFFIVIGLLSFISLAMMYGSIRLLFSEESPSQEEVFVVFSEEGNPSVSNAVILKTPGGDIKINDIRTLPNVIQMSDVRYEIQTPDATEFFNPFSINFAADSGTFAISLSEEPLADTRREMEVFLQNILGISESEMCELQVYVGVNVRVNEFLSGQNLGFSFCPGSVALD